VNDVLHAGFFREAEDCYCVSEFGGGVIEVGEFGIMIKDLIRSKDFQQDYPLSTYLFSYPVVFNTLTNQ